MLPQTDAGYFQQWLVSGITTGKEEPVPSTPLRAPAAQGREETLDWMMSRTAEEREAASRRLEAVIAEAEARAHGGERQTGLTRRHDVRISPDGPRPLEDVAPVLPQFNPEDGFESLSQSVLSEPVFRGDDAPTTATTADEPLSTSSPSSPSLTAPPTAWCPPGRRNSRDEVHVSIPGPSRRPLQAQAQDQPRSSPEPRSPSSCDCSVQRSTRLVSELASYLCIPGTPVDDVLQYVLEHDRLRRSVARQYPQDAARFNAIDWGEVLSADTAAAFLLQGGGSSRTRRRKRCCCWCAAPRLLRSWVRPLALFAWVNIHEALDVIQRRKSLFPMETDKRRMARVAGKARAWDVPGTRRYRLTGVAAVFDVGMALLKRSNLLGGSSGPQRGAAVIRVRQWKPPGRSPLHIGENTVI